MIFTPPGVAGFTDRDRRTHVYERRAAHDDDMSANDDEQMTEEQLLEMVRGEAPSLMSP